MILDKKSKELLFCYFVLTMLILIYKRLYEYISPFVFSFVILGTLLSFIVKYKKVSFVVKFLYTLVVASQVSTLWNTGGLLTPLILENMDSIYSINKDILLSSVWIFCAYLFLFIFFLLHIELPINIVLVSKDNVLLLLFLLYVCWLFFGGISNLPVMSFAKSAYKVVCQLFYNPDEKIIKEQKKLYEKNWVYKNIDEENVPNLSGKNVVTFFVEGFSLKVVDKFNFYPNLTPNISRFMDRGLWFDNYYNHTATTYRAIRGQLTSSYQLNGIAYYENVANKKDLSVKNTSDKLINVTSILKDNGYHTYFLSPHNKSAVFNDYIALMGFDRVYTASDFKNDNERLSDYELFQGLKKIISSGELKEPYFIAVYNWGTHYGEKTPYFGYKKDGKRINNLVDVMHNFDIEFGGFVDWFDKHKEINDDTYMILTSDHMTFPDNLYIRTFNDLKRLYSCIAGRIPFVLYGKGVEHKVIDAKGRNSLAFAPTLLNWLRINNAKNYFLGCSLHDEKCLYPFEYIYAMGDFYYHNTCRVLPKEDSIIKLILKIKDFYNFSAVL